MSMLSEHLSSLNDQISKQNAQIEVLFMFCLIEFLILFYFIVFYLFYFISFISSLLRNNCGGRQFVKSVKSLYLVQI
jgi:hypothetical protein